MNNTTLLLFCSGTFIAKIRATSVNNVTYSSLMTWSGASDYFTINPKTGIITSGASSFDYEQIKIFRMQFRARESEQLFSTCLVVVFVQDLNDNSPTFVTESFEGRVLENSPKGTEVLKIQAQDDDTGAGGEVRIRTIMLVTNVSCLEQKTDSSLIGGEKIG